MGNNLRSLRVAKGWTHDEAANAVGVSRSQFIKLERGERRLTSDYIARAARAFGVSEADVITEPAMVRVVGYVGAGALAHIFGEGDAPHFEEVPAPEGATDKTVAVEIRGESLGPLFDGWLAFYDDRRDPPTPEMLNKVCVVGLPDGRVLIKKLRKSGFPGRYILESQFEPPLYDVPVAWAALVTDIRPR